MSKYRSPSSDYDQRKFGEEFLQSIIDWIGEWMYVDEVFDEDKLKEFFKDHAEEYGYVEASHE